jgi:hypothetical protein
MSAGQLELFGSESAPSRYPEVPGFKAAGPSQEAAKQIAPSVTRLQRVVLAELANWPDGKTADELAILCRLSPFSTRPRLTELQIKGRVFKTGRRRPNESGMTASVWRAA